MRLKNVEVKELFGVFHHEIPMDKPEGVTIIHGPNGFGKTVMLKMIAGALTGDPTVFQSIPFAEFRLDFDDGTSWILKREQDKEREKSDSRQILHLTIRDSAGCEHPAKIDDVELTPAVRRILDRIDTRVPGPFTRYGTGWRNAAGTFFSLSEILHAFPGAANAVPRKELVKALGNSWLPLGIDVFFVEANRLVSTNDLARPDRNPLISTHYGFEEPDGPPPPRIEQYSSDLVQRIKNVRSQYAKVTSERDSTFPERLVQFLRKQETALEESAVVAKLEELDRKRQNLITLGFLDREGVLGSFKEEDARLAREALTIYVGDVQEKLRAFDEMADRMGKLVQILKDRFQYKTVRISQEQGFVVDSEAGGKIRLADLSSGEQHEIILLYELLFRTPPNGLILVDEPEISLHVGWQKHFLADLIDILKLNGAYALVATHSPVLIGTQWNLAKELNGPSQPSSQEPADA